MLTSCEDAFNVDSTGNLTGTKAAEMVEKDPEFLASCLWSVFMDGYSVHGL